MDEDGYVVNVDVAVVRDGTYLLIERGGDEDNGAGLLASPGGGLETTPGDRGAEDTPEFPIGYLDAVAAARRKD